jgi:hypothetical protein
MGTLRAEQTPFVSLVSSIESDSGSRRAALRYRIRHANSTEAYKKSRGRGWDGREGEREKGTCGC